MAICRLMCLDFMDGTGRYDDDGAELYSDENLDEGAAYAQWLLGDGYTQEPFYRFDLRQFRAWCKDRLKKGPPEGPL